jgi:hypothetical protein
MSSRASLLSSLFFLSMASACGSGDTTSHADSGTLDGSASDAAGDFVASCVYENTFSRRIDCREYRGTWNATTAAADCARVFFNAAGTLTVGSACELTDVIGVCVVGDLEANGTATLSTGTAEACGATRTACETFARGTFEPAAVCDTSCTAVDPNAPPPFTPMIVDCRAPADGEGPGMGPDGQVCTPTIISGSTEPGRQFADYASCDAVRTQRPYYGAPSTPTPDPTDARLTDSDYMAEVAWLKAEAEASACVCCHAASRTPSGAAVWDTEAGALWVDTLTDRALAMFAGYTDSAAFGFLPAAENNGFDRSLTGLPTTDVARLQRFAEREFTRRGVTLEQARAESPFAPFFRDLIDYTPSACEDGIGIDADGNVRWTGGAARYLSILEAGSKSPGVPPNWDLPEGTLWAIAVGPATAPMSCGMQYGEVPAGATQRVPSSGSAPRLTSGQMYYLYVQADVVQPITRCTFVAP